MPRTHLQSPLLTSMRGFSRPRERRGFPCLQVAGSTLFLWTCIIVWSYLQSVCFRQQWHSSARAVVIIKRVGSLHGTTPPVLRHSVLPGLYARSKSPTKEVKPRTWPHHYDSMLRTNNAPESMSAALPWAGRNETFHRLHKFPGTCSPRSEWHTYSFPTCNVLHEVSLRSGLIASSSDEQRVDKRTREMRADYGFAGATREAWLLHSPVCANGTHGCPSTTSTIILKTLRWRELHDQTIHDMQRIDAVVSERLTASPHVIDIYGYCGASALNEYADGGMFAKTFRHHYSDKKTYTDDELLVFARDAALSLADIHDLDGRGNVTSFVHHDLRAENFLTSNGVLKVSDFNNGQLLRWDFGQKKRCNGFDWSGGCGATMENTNRKAPEECLEEADRTLTTEKVEVYRFGAFLFFLLSKGNWPYSYEPRSNGTLHRPKPAKVKKMIVSGKKPSLPQSVKESNSTAIRAIMHAMEMAYTYDAKKRPSAREIAEYLVRGGEH